MMETCQWFAQCSNPATHQAEHPTLGWVDICSDHVEWLGPNPSPTQFVPPLAANVLNRHPAAKALHAYVYDEHADCIPPIVHRCIPPEVERCNHTVSDLL